MRNRPVVRLVASLDVLDVADPEVDAGKHPVGVGDVLLGQVETGVVKQRRHAVAVEVAVVVRRSAGSLDDRETALRLPAQRVGPMAAKRAWSAMTSSYAAVPLRRRPESACNFMPSCDRQGTLALSQLEMLFDDPAQLVIHELVVRRTVDLPDELVTREDALHVDRRILIAADEVAAGGAWACGPPTRARADTVRSGAPPRPPTADADPVGRSGCRRSRRLAHAALCVVRAAISIGTLLGSVPVSVLVVTGTGTGVGQDRRDGRGRGAGRRPRRRGSPS